MRTKIASRTFTVRFPEELHQEISSVAAQRQQSLNALLQGIAEAFLREQEEKALFESFTRLGENLEECDIENAWEVQRETEAQRFAT